MGFYVLWLELATGMVLGYDSLRVFLKQWNAIKINKTKKGLEVEFLPLYEITLEAVFCVLCKTDFFRSL